MPEGLRMKVGTAKKIALDVAMAVTLVAIMATALVQEAPHEWLGVALFVLIVVHIVVNRKRLVAVSRGRHTALRIVQIAVLALLVTCVIGQVASSLVLSKHAFGFLPALPGAGWARRVHMICSYWSFVLAFAHAGLHMRTPKGMSSWQKWAARILLAAVACFGAYSFVQLGLWRYLTGQVQFASADFSAPLILTAARYASVAVLVMGALHYIRVGMSRRPEKRLDDEG